MEWRVCGATYCCVYVFGGLPIGSYIVCIVFVSQKLCTCVFVCQKQLEDSNRVFWHMLDLLHASLGTSLAASLGT